MSRKVGFIGAVLLAGGIMGIASQNQAMAQVLDGTRGPISRCDLYRSLGRALPPECGGSGQGLGGVTRGRVHLGSPSAAPAAAPATTGAAAAPVRAAAPPATPPRAAGPASGPSLTSPPAARAAAEPQMAGRRLAFPELDRMFCAAGDGNHRPAGRVFKANGTDRYVIGATDITGDAAHNQTLSERRARAVVRYLVERHGFPESRFLIRGVGSAHLLLPNDPGNARNRRVAVLAVDS